MSTATVTKWCPKCEAWVRASVKCPVCDSKLRDK